MNAEISLHYPLLKSTVDNQIICSKWPPCDSIHAVWHHPTDSTHLMCSVSFPTPSTPLILHCIIYYLFFTLLLQCILYFIPAQLRKQRGPNCSKESTCRPQGHVLGSVGAVEDILLMTF